MRKLLYFVMGFGAVCLLWSSTLDWKIRLIGVGIVLVFGTLAGRDARFLRRLTVTFLGCMAGFLWYCGYEALYLAAAERLDGATVEAEIRVCADPYDTAYGAAFDGGITLEGKPYQVRTYVDKAEGITPGDYVYGSFRFRSTLPGGRQETSYHQGKGIFLLAYQEGKLRVEDYPPTRRDIPVRLRGRIEQVLEEYLTAGSKAFAKALLIGDTSELDYGTDTDLKISGIRHVAAVSGLHVSILTALLGMVTLRKRYFTALLGFPMLVFFAALAGFTPSVCRACIMSGLMLLAMVTNREYDGISALSFAVLVILLCNPLAASSVSLQMSVASVAGIYLFDPGLRKWFFSKFPEKKGRRLRDRLVKWFVSSVCISLSAMVLTVPISAYYFGAVSLIGPLTNLLVLWIISAVFCGLMGLCVLSVISAAGAAWLGKGLSLVIRGILLAAEMLADAPMAAVYTASPYITGWLVFVYCLLILYLAGQQRSAGELASWAVLGLCLALLASWTEPMLTETRFTMLDVGQGQCLLVQAEGKSFLVDCGGDSDTQSADMAAEALLSQGITRLDGMILTHLDRDHAGGAAGFLERVETDLLILPAVSTDLAEHTSARVIYASQTLQLAFGTTKIKIYPPTFPGNSNEMSLCILFDTKNCDILVTGDRSGFGERSLLRNADIPDVDILVAGHHGSKNATCPELLQAVKPETVCISAGKDNPYGHPARETLQRLEEFGCAVYRTDRSGTVTIRR